MPYIPMKRREALDAYAEALIAHMKASNFEGSYLGDVTYVMTRIVHGTFQAINGPIRWWQITAIMGILESMKIEFYSRVAGPYERMQCEASGDVKEFIPKEDMEEEHVPKPRGRFPDEPKENA